MRKMAVAVFLLGVIAALGFYESYKIENICSLDGEKTEEILKSVEENDFSAAREEMKNFKDKWEKDEKFLDAVTTHEDTDTVNVLLCELEENIHQENLKEARMVIQKLKLQFEHILKRSEIKITNIL